ncbi:MAG: Glycine cleavage system transcriptional activator [Candidatus Celerinatantimonas neptuna]|nr:MAG: Glycine cleavage system transcriptional activator [Candidatus Celerinatantimonas neptuna]
MVSKLPPLYALRAFEQAAKYSSFTEAAEILSITPSAISRHVKTLENHLNCKLFIRKGPKIDLTDAGNQLAQQLRDSFYQLETACETFITNRHQLRLKSPSTLTMRWLLTILKKFEQQYPNIAVQIFSIWMDVDSVDFLSEPYDCAILLGHGQNGSLTKSRKLFDEWLIPICSPQYLEQKRTNLDQYDLIHPSIDKRDWRRWLKHTYPNTTYNINRGMIFDTLEQGNIAAIQGHGLSIGDLTLCQNAIREGLLQCPFPQAVGTGDGYYLVWPEKTNKHAEIEEFYSFLLQNVPAIDNNLYTFLNSAIEQFA